MLSQGGFVATVLADSDALCRVPLKASIGCVSASPQIAAVRWAASRSARDFACVGFSPALYPPVPEPKHRPEPRRGRRIDPYVFFVGAAVPCHSRAVRGALRARFLDRGLWRRSADSLPTGATKGSVIGVRRRTVVAEHGLHPAAKSRAKSRPELTGFRFTGSEASYNVARSGAKFFQFESGQATTALNRGFWRWSLVGLTLASIISSLLRACQAVCWPPSGHAASQRGVE